MNMENAVVQKVSLIGAMAAKYSIEPTKFLATMKATVFDGKASDEEMIAFLAVANRYDLDPFRKEVFAFRKGNEGGGVQPIVSVDGWSSIANRQPDYDGVSFEDKFEGDALVSVTCRIFHKNRTHATEVTEYLRECKRNTMPWNQWPSRMLRHKAFIQCVRLAFGISGIMEPDEVERMVDVQARVVDAAPIEAPPKTIADLKTRAKKEKSQQEEPPPAEEAPATLSATPAVAAAPTASPAKNTGTAKLLELIGVYKEMLAESVFVAILKKHGGDLGMLNLGLGSDGLKALLDELNKATGP